MINENDELNMLYVGREPVHDDLTGEDITYLLNPEDAMSFVKRQLVSTDTSENLVATSVKLPPSLIYCLENNSKLLGISKSDLHRKALEIGLNSITDAYCSLTNQNKIISE